MNTKTEAILKAIRDACPELYELSWGCVIETFIYPQYPVELKVINEQYKSDVLVCCNIDGELTFISKNDTTIIAHPPELRHLLKAIKERVDIVTKYTEKDCIEITCAFLDEHNEVYGAIATYNLTLPLLENLEKNEALRDVVYELLVDKQ